MYLKLRSVQFVQTVKLPVSLYEGNGPWLHRILRFIKTMSFEHVQCYQSSLSHEGHRASTIVFHFCRSWAALLASHQVMLISLRSFWMLLCRVFLGLPRFRVPCGFQSIAWRAMFLSSFLSVWPIHLQRFLLHVMVVLIGSWPVLSVSVFGEHDPHSCFVLVIFIFFAWV